MKVNRRNLMKSGIVSILAFFGLDKIFTEEKIEDVIPVGHTIDQYSATGYIYAPYVPLYVQGYCRNTGKGWISWKPDTEEGEEER